MVAFAFLTKNFFFFITWWHSTCLLLHVEILKVPHGRTHCGRSVPPERTVLHIDASGFPKKLLRMICGNNISSLLPLMDKKIFNERTCLIEFNYYSIYVPPFILVYLQNQWINDATPRPPHLWPVIITIWKQSAPVIPSLKPFSIPVISILKTK